MAKPSQFEGVGQVSKPNMAGILELSDQEFKTAMSNVLRAVMSKVNSMQEQMSNPQKTKQREGGLDKTEQSIQGLRTATKSVMCAQ